MTPVARGLPAHHITFSVHCRWMLHQEIEGGPKQGELGIIELVEGVT